MSKKIKTPPQEKTQLHPRNWHRERYDFKVLTATCPELGPYVITTPYGAESVDFFNPDAVKLLNKALLKHFYGIEHWDIPANYLCPPIPGRADYIHHIADVLAASNQGRIPKGAKITCLDIGVGANCVYPIIGNKVYGWSFIGSDIDSVAIKSAEAIVKANPSLTGKVELRLQNYGRLILRGLLKPDEFIDVVVCNPPFHASAAEAVAESTRKLNHLQEQKTTEPVLNFGGQARELWCEGGELRFIKDLIRESAELPTACFWYSSLVSKASNLHHIKEALSHVNPTEVKVIDMAQGNKTSRLIAWTFLSPDQQKKWAAFRWKG